MSVAWSYSALSAFETCPWRYYLTRVEKKVKEPQTAATVEGNEVHRALDESLKTRKPLPDKYVQFTPLVDKIRSSPGKLESERKFALNSAYRETTYFAKDVWLRGVFDVSIINKTSAVVLDWKTGKPKNDGDQLRLFAASAFEIYPYVQTVRTGYVWLRHNRIDTETFSREDKPEIWQEFVTRVRRIEIAKEEDRWPKRPSGLCREWCPVGQALCEHCGS